MGGKKTCTCDFTFTVAGNGKAKGTGSCDKKCSGNVKEMTLNSATYSYTFGFGVKKGKVKVGKVEAVAASIGTTPSATRPTEESRTTCFAPQTPAEMEAVMPVRETQAAPPSLVVRTATVEPLLDRTMSSSVSSPLELAALRPISPEFMLGQLLRWTGSTQTPCLSKPAAEGSRGTRFNILGPVFG